MSKMLVNDSTLENIANAIRTKGGASGTMLPSEMATNIANIPSGGGGKNIQIDTSIGTATTQNYTLLSQPTLTIGKTGTYTLYCCVNADENDSCSCQILRNGNVIKDGVGSNLTVTVLTEASLSEGDVITIQARVIRGVGYGFVGMLVAQEQ